MRSAFIALWFLVLILAYAILICALVAHWKIGIPFFVVGA